MENLNETQCLKNRIEFCGGKGFYGRITLIFEMHIVSNDFLNLLDSIFKFKSVSLF